MRNLFCVAIACLILSIVTSKPVLKQSYVQDRSIDDDYRLSLLFSSVFAVLPSIFGSEIRSSSAYRQITMLLRSDAARPIVKELLSAIFDQSSSTGSEYNDPVDVFVDDTGDDFTVDTTTAAPETTTVAAAVDFLSHVASTEAFRDILTTGLSQVTAESFHGTVQNMGTTPPSIYSTVEAAHNERSTESWVDPTEGPSTRSHEGLSLSPNDSRQGMEPVTTPASVEPSQLEAADEKMSAKSSVMGDLATFSFNGIYSRLPSFSSPFSSSDAKGPAETTEVIPTTMSNFIADSEKSSEQGMVRDADHSASEFPSHMTVDDDVFVLDDHKSNIRSEQVSLNPQKSVVTPMIWYLMRAFV